MQDFPWNIPILEADRLTPQLDSENIEETFCTAALNLQRGNSKYDTTIEASKKNTYTCKTTINYTQVLYSSAWHIRVMLDAFLYYWEKYTVTHLQILLYNTESE